jgi:hypothetical protein
MTDPSPELERQVEASYSRLEPERVFQGCKVAEDTRGIVVRIYSQSRQRPGVLPPPYRTFRFDADAGTLSALTDEEAAPYRIKNYK